MSLRPLRAAANVSPFLTYRGKILGRLGCRLRDCSSPLGLCPGSFQVSALSKNHSQLNRTPQKAHFRASQPQPHLDFIPSRPDVCISAVVQKAGKHPPLGR